MCRLNTDHRPRPPPPSHQRRRFTVIPVSEQQQEEHSAPQHFARNRQIKFSNSSDAADVSSSDEESFSSSSPVAIDDNTDTDNNGTSNTFADFEEQNLNGSTTTDGGAETRDEYIKHNAKKSAVADVRWLRSAPFQAGVTTILCCDFVDNKHFERKKCNQSYCDQQNASSGTVTTWHDANFLLFSIMLSPCCLAFSSL
uniref:Uncharacterized protein n=1 Tax=Globodera rostochiensis TaxID=31243 RepID=A0A914IBM0_GLORO